MIRANLPTPRSTAAEPLRIGYLLRMYPRFSQTFVVNEIVELERQGVEIAILSLRKSTDGIFHESISRVRGQAYYIPEMLREDPWHLAGLLYDRLRRGAGPLARAARLVQRFRDVTWTDLMQALHLLKWARKHRIRHVHVHFGTSEASVALLAHVLGGLSYSMTLHAFDIFRDNVDRRLLAAKINASAFTITVSEYNHRFLLDHVPGVDASKVRVNYNGIDLAAFNDRGGGRTANTIFSVGRLIEKKGFRYLIEAIELLHRDGLRVHGAIAGDGPEQDALRRQIERAGLANHVKLLGPIRQDEVSRRLQRASCFALPCVQARDGNIDALPTVLLESLAAGCPSVSTRLSGIPEIIEHEVSGLLVEPGQAPALADAIRRVLTEPGLAAGLSVGGLHRAEVRFNVRQNVAVMRQWLAEAAGVGGNPVEPMKSRKRVMATAGCAT